MNAQLSTPVGSDGSAPIKVRITNGGAGYVGFDLPGDDRRAPEVARFLLRRALRGQDTDDLVLCADELVCNAITHTRSGLPGGRFLLTLQVEGGGIVLVSVLDEGARTGQDPSAHPVTDEHGRGLIIVRGLSIESGKTNAFTGRLAWFRIKVSGRDTQPSSRDVPRDGTETPLRDETETLTRDAPADALRDLALAGRRS
jgi:serine/threonine-protein kinase RsbW